MTDYERPAYDPTTETTSTEVPATPIATTPLAPSGTPAGAGPRRNRVRWLAAAGIVALIVGVTAIATLTLTGSTPTSTVAGYVPGDSVAYGEVRLDLPGDQRQEVGEFLSKFPGFADQAALETKLDEVLDRLLSESTGGKQTYSRDIKPWFDGEFAFSMAPPTGVAATNAATDTPRAVVLLSIKDEALARTWFTNALAEMGVTTVTESYEGVELLTFTNPEEVSGRAAFAIVDAKVAIVGDITSVKAAIDTGGGSPFAQDDSFETAKAAFEGDDIGFVFVDLRTLMDTALEMTESLASVPPLSGTLTALVPEWSAFRLRVEGDGLVMDGAMPDVEAAPGPSENHPNGVAAYAPPTTLAIAAGNDLGATLTETLALYRSDPAMAEAFKGIDESAALLGGLEKSVGWMGDTGLVIARDGDSVEGGIISIPADAAAGAQLLTTLRTFATFAGGQAGITVREEEHAGTTITIIDLGSAEDLAALAAGLGGVPVPDDATSALPEGNIEIAYAATDGVVTLGSSPDFVKHVLDAGAGQSLADDARYAGLVGRVGSSHTGVSFFDITAVRSLLESHLSEATADERAEYEESIKPFLTPFDAFVAAGVIEDGLNENHALITVK
jgi:hypothetical protein